MPTSQPPLAWITPPESTSALPPLTVPAQVLVAVPLLVSPAGNVSVNPTPESGNPFGFDSVTFSTEGAPACTELGLNDFETVGPNTIPVPARLTVCGVPVALLATDSVPVRAPDSVDTKVTLIVQLFPAASEVPHPFVCEKSPAAVMPEIASVPVPVFANVTACAELAAPTTLLPKDSDGGVRETAGAVPVPDRPTVCGLPSALVEIEMDPGCSPASVGVKVTLMVQGASVGASVVGQLCNSANGGAVEMLLMTKDALPVLVKVTAAGGAVVPTLVAGKVNCVCDRVATGAGGGVTLSVSAPTGTLTTIADLAAAEGGGYT